MIIRKNTPSIRSDRPVKTFGNNMVSRPETGRSVSLPTVHIRNGYLSLTGIRVIT